MDLWAWGWNDCGNGQQWGSGRSLRRGTFEKVSRDCKRVSKQMILY